MIKEYTIEGQKIQVIDEVISSEETKKFYRFSKSLPFRRHEYDDEEDEYPIFSVDFEPLKFQHSMDVGIKLSSLMAKLELSDSFRLKRAYINMSHFGDVEFPHYDCSNDEKDITVLLYVNEYWDYRWGGETLFYLNHEPVLAVLPKPGRVVIFPGNIEHLGGTPTRICKQSRLSLALKYTFVTS